MGSQGRRRAQKGAATVSVREVAEQLGVEAKTVRDWIRRKRMKAAQPFGKGGEYLIRQREVDRVWDEIKGQA